MMVTLIQEPYTFRRKRNVAGSGTVYFCCCGCEHDGKTLLASAYKTVTEEEEEEADEYLLTSIPECDEHICVPSGTEVFKKACIKRMEKMVSDDPTQSIPEVYNEARKEFTKSMDMETKISFLQSLPSYRNIQSQLYKKRRDFIPPNPMEASGLDLNSPWFTYNKETGESIVKGDRQLSDGRRILVLSTDDHLNILARAG